MDIEEDDEFGDWRISAVSTIVEDLPQAYPGGPSAEAGSAVYLSSLAKHPTFGQLGFITPNPSALALNMAFKSASRAKRIQKTIAYKDAVSPDGPAKQVAKENHAHLYDYFEECMASIVFSYLAIEVFANREIVRNGKSQIEIKRKKKRYFLSPKEAERQLSTEEKIGVVLPKLLSLPTPKGKSDWEGFKILKRARDAIIHMKDKEVQSKNSPDDESIFFELLNNDPMSFPINAFRIIEYFFKASDSEPRWARCLRKSVGI